MGSEGLSWCFIGGVFLFSSLLSDHLGMSFKIRQQWRNKNHAPLGCFILYNSNTFCKASWRVSSLSFSTQARPYNPTNLANSCLIMPHSVFKLLLDLSAPCVCLWQLRWSETHSQNAQILPNTWGAVKHEDSSTAIATLHTHREFCPSTHWLLRAGVGSPTWLSLTKLSRERLKFCILHEPA